MLVDAAFRHAIVTSLGLAKLSTVQTTPVSVKRGCGGHGEAQYMAPTPSEPHKLESPAGVCTP